MTFIFLKLEDLNSEQFEVVNNKIRIKSSALLQNIDFNPSDRFQRNILDPSPTGSWNVTNNEPNKRMYIEEDTIGATFKIHIDGKCPEWSGQHVIAQIPSSITSLPNELVEIQLYDGATIWLEPNSRDIKIGNGFFRNRRYIADISYHIYS